MIRWLGGTFPISKPSGRVGLLPGSGSFAYLPFDCTMRRVAVLLTSDVPCTGSVTLEANAVAIGASMPFTLGSVGLYEPLASSVILPGVTSGNLDGAGKLSWRSTFFGGATTDVKIGMELSPVDLANANSEVWTLYGTGDWGTFGRSLFAATQSAGSAGAAWNMGDPGFAGGYMHAGIGSTHPVFNTLASHYENGETWQGSSAMAGGAATPLARPGTFKDLRLISSEAGGFDGSYTFSLRKNGIDTLSVTASGATRIFTDTDSIHFDAGDQWCFKAVASSGTRVLGHLLVTFTPDSTVIDGGFGGQTGFGGTGFGG